MNKNEEDIEKLEIENPTPKPIENETPRMKAIEIAKIQDSKQGNIIGVIIFFIILIGFIIAMPYINDLDSMFKRNNPTQTNEPSNNTNSGENEEKKEEPDYYTLTTAQITYDELVFSNFELRHIEDYTVLFNVTTTKNTGKSLNNTNYFLELFTTDKTLIERVKIEKNITISKNGLSELEFNISENSYNNATNIRIISKTIEDYPEVTLTKDTNDLNILTCINKENKIIYSFDEKKQLVKIEDINTFEKGEDVDGYLTLLSNKRSEVASLNNQNGVSSSLSESSTGFETNTLILLSDANINNLKNHNYYNKETLAKAVAFEMSARGYICS